MKLLYVSRILLALSLFLSALSSNAFKSKAGAVADSAKTIKTDALTAGRADIKISTTAASADTGFKPIRRLWGYTFGDFYYDAHTDLSARGGETNYGGVPTYRNSFQFRRLYLGYDYDITRKFTAVILLASEPNASTGVSGSTSISNSDNLVDNKISFYIKYAYLKINDIWPGTSLVLGEQPTNTWSLTTEQTWGHRWIERTVVDLHKLGNSYDVGAGLQGAFDPKTRNFGYNLIVGGNQQAVLASAANANTGFYKQFYGDVWAKLLDQHLYLDFYGDYVRTAAATAALGAQSHNLLKAAAAYSVPAISFGIEAFSDKITNGLTGVLGSTKTPSDATAIGLSVFTYGSIIKNKLGFFARFDTYNPDNDFNTAYSSYTVNTNLSSYSPYQKEKFYTAGLDFTPVPNVHFSPNFWLIEFNDQRTPATTGYLANDHTLIYRLTFFYTFGK